MAGSVALVALLMLVEAVAALLLPNADEVVPNAEPVPKAEPVPNAGAAPNAEAAPLPNAELAPNAEPLPKADALETRAAKLAAPVQLADVVADVPEGEIAVHLVEE